MVVIDSWWKPRYCIGLYEPIRYADNTSDSLISKSIDFNKQLAIDKLNTELNNYLPISATKTLYSSHILPLLKLWNPCMGNFHNTLITKKAVRAKPTPITMHTQNHCLNY